ncbi:MAG: lamin tail domain-containing protein [Candidatus Nealsonbacteria bacterium]|nr:lamin tail domain-containing protein [Candidatus Nealsonbacteria bacterium]
MSMTGLFFIIFLFLSGFFPVFVYGQEINHLIIVEVQIRGEKANNDFIKIYNLGGNNLDISGYRLRKRVSTGSESSVRVFPSGSKILAKGCFLWANSKDDFRLSVKADVWSTQTLARNNSIALLNPENKIIDALAWGESQNPFVKGAPFPENPTANQQLKRKRFNGNYQNTNNNSQDFYLYPSLETSLLKTEAIIKEEPGPELKPEPKPQEPAKELSRALEQAAPLTMEAKTPPQSSEVKEADPFKIDINTALLKDLVKIVHIGKVRAEELISLRPFYSLDDLTRIKGISPKRLEDIKKQGLAWVDPELEPPKIEKTEPLDKGLAAVAQPLKQGHLGRQIPKSLSIFLIAFVLAIFSGIIILILKRKLKLIIK